MLGHPGRVCHLMFWTGVSTVGLPEAFAVRRRVACQRTRVYRALVPVVATFVRLPASSLVPDSAVASFVPEAEPVALRVPSVL